MCAIEGIKKYGDKSIAVLLKEFKQLDEGPIEGKKVEDMVRSDDIYRKPAPLLKGKMVK